MTQTRKVPEGYNRLQPYLIQSNCRAAMDFYIKIFNAKEKLVMPRDNGGIMHAELDFNGSIMMLADEHPEIEAYAPAHYGGSPVGMLIYVDDCDASYNSALAAGATSLREPADQPYGDRMAGVTDPFGYKWWIAHSLGKAEETKS